MGILKTPAFHSSYIICSIKLWKFGSYPQQLKKSYFSNSGVKKIHNHSFRAQNVNMFSFNNTAAVWNILE
jgi:hypothetical protein